MVYAREEEINGCLVVMSSSDAGSLMDMSEGEEATPCSESGPEDDDFIESEDDDFMAPKKRKGGTLKNSFKKRKGKSPLKKLGPPKKKPLAENIIEEELHIIRDPLRNQTSKRLKEWKIKRKAKLNGTLKLQKNPD